jgi:hypothetical protein
VNASGEQFVKTTQITEIHGQLFLTIKHAAAPIAGAKMASKVGQTVVAVSVSLQLSGTETIQF